MTDDFVADASRRTLHLNVLELVGGGRTVRFQQGLNLIRGDITTGKTTLIRLVKGFLGNVPRHLPPEAADIRALRGQVVLGGQTWSIFRPMVTTNQAPVEIALATADSLEEEGALQLPAAGEGGYGEFLLAKLSLPIVSVPRARRNPTADLSPVTINDWLLYCIVTGDELDTQVFGHRDAFRDLKRRWVFEIAYGLYDEELADLGARLRRIDLEIGASETEAEVIRQFLAGTPFAKPNELETELTELHSRLSQLRSEAQDLQGASEVEPGTQIASYRARVLAVRRELDELSAEVRHRDSQLLDLSDLIKQLSSLSKRLTRSIVADEWMVDFDFVVCPRCGHDVDQDRTAHPICYLCGQVEPSHTPDREVLIREQDRVTYQIAETEQLIEERTDGVAKLRWRERELRTTLAEASARLDALTGEFVSARAANIQAKAYETATVEANIGWIERYLALLGREADQADRLEALKARKLQLEEEIEAHRTVVSVAEDNIGALESRMVDYLNRLHVPQLGDLLTVHINRKTYLPEVSGRTFDELSSQGLKTLVNVAHALAHHTVAIDRNLALPGLLVLDGVSANSGKEGLEGDRIVDMYRLFDDVAAEYGQLLQLIIVDNDLPPDLADDLADAIVLTLSQEARLIGAS